MKRILLCTDGSGFASGVYQYGAWFAQRLGAAIAVLHVTDVRGQARAEAANLSGSIGIDASDHLLQALVDLEHQKAKLSHQQAKVILRSATTTLQELGVTSIQTMHKTGVLVDFLPELETTTDLVILGRRGAAEDFATTHLGANLDRMIRASRRPCLVTSRQFQPIARILLAYDGSAIGQKALQFVLTSPAFQGLPLHIITVAKSRSDTTAQARLHTAQQQAENAGVEAVGVVEVGHPEAAIAAYIDQAAIDLLVMGTYGHRRIRHLVIGSTTAQILRSSPIPVLVFR
ncbi:universal stress protein [Spirulina major]|uniref:universal stress protein n=1 Tax=Spirulina major TaxID=270636 RepID=UPI00093258EC|nr:universal stress protein [Spirulina major]